MRGRGWGSKFLPFRVDQFSGGKKGCKNFLIELPLLNVYQFASIYEEPILHIVFPCLGRPVFRDDGNFCVYAIFVLLK